MTDVKEKMKDTFPDLKIWRKYPKDKIMTAVYWSQGYLPPTETKIYEQEWQKLKKQLEVKYG